MRVLERNKVEFWYSLFKEKVAKTDEYGNETGETTIVRGNPQKYRANISAAKGEVSVQQFGVNETYDKVIVADNLCPAIDEYTVLWVDTAPQLDDDGSLSTDDDGNVITPYDYIVKKVARSINSVSFAISKVDVS